MATFTINGSNASIKYNTDGGSTGYTLSNGATIVALTIYYFKLTPNTGYKAPRMTHSGGGTGWLTNHENDTESMYQTYFSVIPANTTLTLSATEKTYVTKTATLEFDCYGKNSSGTIIKTGKASGSKSASGNPDLATIITGVTTNSVTPSGLGGTNGIDHAETGTRIGIARCKDNYSGSGYETFGTVSQTSCGRGKFTSNGDNSATTSETMDITVPAGLTTKTNVVNSRTATLPKTNIGGTGGSSNIGNVTLPSTSKYNKRGHYYTQWNNSDTLYNASTSIGLYSSSTTAGTYYYNFVPEGIAEQTNITLDTQGGIISGSSSYAVTYSFANNNNINGQNPLKGGHTFQGGYDAASGGNQVYDATGACVNDSIYWNNSTGYYDPDPTVGTPIHTLTLYAHGLPNTYVISTSTNPSGAGSISGGGSYTYGSTCTLVASANSGYEFIDGNDSISTSTRSFIVTKNDLYTANFQSSVPVTSSSLKIKNNDEGIDASSYVKVDGEGKAASIYVKKQGSWTPIGN